MTGGDDILYLITLRNLEIHLVIGLCCFEVCFGTGLFTGLQWYSSPYQCEANSLHIAPRVSTLRVSNCYFQYLIYPDHAVHLFTFLVSPDVELNDKGFKRSYAIKVVFS